MHMHAGHTRDVRTTIEITEAQRAELLKIAGNRGEKGFSAVVREALDMYLKNHASRAESVRAALGVRGALSDEEGDSLEQEVAVIRRNWR